VQVVQNGKILDHEKGQDQSGRFLIYKAQPNGVDILISEKK
jgi:hypothetical protein